MRLLKVTAVTLALMLIATPAFADQIFYAHTDVLGNVVLVTDENRNIVERRVYEPYGLPRTPIPDGPGFTGHDMDGESGLVYMQQRYYDPMVGRFLSVDPVGTNPATGANFNRYWYANNNPYKFFDPDGRDSYLVSRKLQGLLGSGGNHNFIVHHADKLGDPNATIRSFGDRGDDTLGEVTSDTEGFSGGTFASDSEAWASLAGGGGGVTYRRIEADDDVVKANADKLVAGQEYSAIPALQGGVNSNTAAGAIAKRSDGGAAAVDNDRRQPGSEDSAIQRIKFREK